MPRYDTTHFYLQYDREGSAKDDILEIAAQVESEYTRIKGLMGFMNDVQITYYLHDNVNNMPTDDKEETSVTVLPDELHTIYNYFNKDVAVKSIAEIMINKNMTDIKEDIIKVGLFVCLDGKYKGKTFDELMKEALSNGSYMSVSRLFEENVIEQEGKDKVYPLAGAFTEYLISTYGLVSYKDFCASPKELFSRFRLFFGDEIDDLESDFLAFLDKE